MFATDDTIIAVATPPGRGGIGVVRISGGRALDVATAILASPAPLEPRRATFSRLRPASDDSADVGDEVIAIAFPAPRSFTGEDVVELSAHGSPVVLQAIVARGIGAGARLARPGEFTLRAYLHGKRDLVQAEAIADLIEAATPLQARVAFDQLEGTLTRRIAVLDGQLFDLIARLEASIDFPEEGFHFIEREEIVSRAGDVLAAVEALLRDAPRGRMIREGVTVTIAGRPNVGKSSLFNALARQDRAIVTDIPGTTRDFITERVEIDGLLVTLVDTAGEREPEDRVEREGVMRAARARDAADLVLVVLDGSEPLTDGDRQLLASTRHQRRIIVSNKCDRQPAPDGRSLGALSVSAMTGDGMDALRASILRTLTGTECLRDTAAISNARHIELMRDARECLTRVCAAAAAGTPEEFLLADLQAARVRFDEVVGRRTDEDVLRYVFERFCIGK